MTSRAHNGKITDAVQAIKAHGDSFTAQWLRSRCQLSLRQAHNAISQALANGIAVRVERGHYRTIA